jgi:hypothetical protein
MIFWATAASPMWHSQVRPSARTVVQVGSVPTSDNVPAGRLCATWLSLSSRLAAKAAAGADSEYLSGP